jgi:putative peptidoglycan lipid II flippase
MVGKMNKNRVVGITILLFIVSALTSIIGFCKEAVFANFYGISLQADAFVVSIQVPVILFAMVASAIRTIIIPLYSEKYYKDGKQEADIFFSNLSSMVFFISGIFAVGGIIFADAIIYAFAPGLNIKTHSLATTFLRIIFPMVIFSGLTDTITGVLNIHHSFILPKLSVNIKNIIFVIITILFTKIYGIYAAIIGTLLGAIIEFSCLIYMAKKYIRYKPILNLRDPMIKKTMMLSYPIFISTGAAEINRLADSICVSLLSSGSISSLNYASKLSKVFNLLTHCILTVLYPMFSKHAARKEYHSLGEIYRYAVSGCILSIVPIICMVVLLRVELISIAFGRGAFGIEAVGLTSNIFIFYMISILFSAIRQTNTRLFYSLGDMKTPAKNAVFGIIINIILNIVLSQVMGAAGLALATLVATMLICVLLIRDIHIKLYYVKYNSLLPLIFKLTFSVIIMSILVILLQNYLSNRLIMLVITIPVGFLIYIGMLIVLRTKEVFILIDIAKNTLKRR